MSKPSKRLTLDFGSTECESPGPPTALVDWLIDNHTPSQILQQTFQQSFALAVRQS